MRLKEAAGRHISTTVGMDRHYHELLGDQRAGVHVHVSVVQCDRQQWYRTSQIATVYSRRCLDPRHTRDPIT
jgi:hypothetical protein